MKNKVNQKDREVEQTNNNSYEQFLNRQQQPYAGYSNFSGDQESLMNQANPSTLLAKLEYQLKGYYFDYDQEEWVFGGKPMMNKQGISRIMTIMSSVVNTNIILSNFDLKEVKLFAFGVHNQIVDLLTQKWETYEMDVADLSTVANMCLVMCFSALKRGYGQGERIFWKTAFRHHENQIITQSPENKQGLLNKAARIFS